jgi:alkylated DNA repair dioxygenase AlkB
MRTRVQGQAKLFDAPQHLPNGLVYRPDFINEDEEELILHYLDNMPMHRGSYTIRSIGETVITKRRMRGWWGTERLPRWLLPLELKVAKWLDVPRTRLGNALVNEYQIGMGMGFHRDEGNIEHIVGISLRGWCTMKFRPYDDFKNPSDIIPLEVEPRSAYIMQKQVHWRYQHSVVPVKTHRYSITFRTHSNQ